MVEGFTGRGRPSIVRSADPEHPGESAHEAHFVTHPDDKAGFRGPLHAADVKVFQSHWLLPVFSLNLSSFMRV
jgi:hypothetical protein